MNIGIIGAGNLGSGLTRQLVKAGDSVMLSYSRSADKLKTTADSLGARAGSPRQAVEFAEVVFLASPWVATAEVLEQLNDVSGPKILWDCTNPLKPDLSGLAIGTTTSAGEEVARLAPWSNVVKAIPPFAELLHSPSTLLNGSPIGVFVCGDDPRARQVVSSLVKDAGAAPFDCGPLSLARYTEPAGMLLVQLAYMQGFGARIGVTLLHEGAK